MLTCLVPVLFKFYIQDVLKLKKNNSGARGLNKTYLLGHVTYDFWAIGIDNIRMIFYCVRWRVPLNTADRHHCCNFVTDIMKLLVTGRYDVDYNVERIVCVHSRCFFLIFTKRRLS